MAGALCEAADASGVLCLPAGSLCVLPRARASGLCKWNIHPTLDHLRELWVYLLHSMPMSQTSWTLWSGLLTKRPGEMCLGWPAEGHLCLGPLTAIEVQHLWGLQPTLVYSPLSGTWFSPPTQPHGHPEPLLSEPLGSPLVTCFLTHLDPLETWTFWGEEDPFGRLVKSMDTLSEHFSWNKIYS